MLVEIPTATYIKHVEIDQVTDSSRFMYQNFSKLFNITE